VLWEGLVDRTPEEWGRDFLHTLERVAARRSGAELGPLSGGRSAPFGAVRPALAPGLFFSRSSNAVN